MKERGPGSGQRRRSRVTCSGGLVAGNERSRALVPGETSR